MMRRLDTRDAHFPAQLDELLAFDPVVDTTAVSRVQDIIARVRSEGDAVVLAYTQQFDAHPAQQFSELVITKAQLEQAYQSLETSVQQALNQAATRIRTFHEHQVQQDWMIEDEYGNRLGQKVTPLDRVGIYVPGGKASYPSSVLMNAIPAQVAGVTDIIMVVPAPQGYVNPLVLAAAHVAGVQQVFTIGGAQAIAALAYGTQSIAKVDKITGPGNQYVAIAKKQVFGTVGIDMIAGPSEIAILADNSAHTDWLAMDLLSQAEHDEVAQAVCISDDIHVLDAIEQAIEQALITLPRQDICRQSLQNRGALILTQSLDESVALLNRIAPEHLQLSINNPEAILPAIKHAGAIFMGHYTPEAFGDYCAGPNHVLPTSGTARFSSPLGVYDFQKRSSVIACQPTGAAPLAQTANILAMQEGLDAHARSAAYRLAVNGDTNAEKPHD